jgi:hypothetical protein
MENQINQQGEMVDNQTVNKINKHLMKRKKKRKNKSPVQDSRISVLVVLVLLLYDQNHFPASPRQVCSWHLVLLEPSCGRWQPVCQWAGRWAAAWQEAFWHGGGLVGQWAGGQWCGDGGLPFLSVHRGVEKTSTC